MPGIAKATWQLCKEAGLTMTDAGATFPYKNDPNDSNMRVAPSLPPTEQLVEPVQGEALRVRRFIRRVQPAGRYLLSVYVSALN